jgi:hypothetical protein
MNSYRQMRKINTATRIQERINHNSRVDKKLRTRKVSKITKQQNNRN